MFIPCDPAFTLSDLYQIFVCTQRFSFKDAYRYYLQLPAHKRWEQSNRKLID